MAQLPAENSTLARAVRRAAEQGRLSHAIVLSGDGDLLDAARFIAASHVCEEDAATAARCWRASTPTSRWYATRSIGS